MKRYLLPIVLLFVVFSCKNTGQGDHLIADAAYRAEVKKHFEAQKAIAEGRASELFGVFDRELSAAEREGLEFLYAFMPLSDLAMNDGEYYLKQVKSSIEARKFFTWGKTIPEDIFLHFVLPYRVNNEYTDTARQVFLRELKSRIVSMSMADAALEVNHWCHEKVIYKGSDERTSGPLTTVRTTHGRCGEESTFTVAAMRSVGIPARQVYTPRWAHTDDNHAWVEVWIDGTWHFLGACEPEPELDMGWFSEPVKRAMMTHTFVFGKYNGSEETIETHDRYARLNLLNHYTAVKRLPIKVVDEANRPVEGAKVQFGLYNYAEFYPIATQYTGADGSCAVTTGYGDLMVHVSKNGISASALARSDEQEPVTIVLGQKANYYPAGTYLLTPPQKQAIPAIDPELIAENNKRLLQEDSIRGIYIATFIDSIASTEMAASLNLDRGELWKYLSLSRGNWIEIAKFAKQLSMDERERGMALLANISEKDLHDILASTLYDHLTALKVFQPVAALSADDYNRYVLSPRMGREFVTPWRSFILRQFDDNQAEVFRNDPLKIREWINDNITFDTINNYYAVPLSPEGVMQLRRADAYSRDLLFVAISRTFGIAARLEPATRRPQFLSENEWNDVFFTRQTAASAPRGNIILRNTSPEKGFIPRYYIHYTIARYDKGEFVTLDYEYDNSLMNFPATIAVDTGFYRLITGNRQSGGEVVTNISYFRVEEGKTTNIDISLAADVEKTGVSGRAELNAAFTGFGNEGELTLKPFLGDKGMIVALIDPSKEPTKHLMEDIKAVKTSLDKWGGNVLFVVAADKLTQGFSPAGYSQLPEKAVFGYDERGEVSTAVSTTCSIEGVPTWPVVAVLNPKGEITWYSEGYRIGLGDQMLKQLKEFEK